MRSDEELMLAHAAGDRAAFDELFRRYVGLVSGLARRYAQSDADVGDLVQQTFLNLHRARHDFSPERKLRPWLVTIALNVAREHGRWRGRRREDPIDVEQQASDAPTADTHVDSRATQRRVRAALRELPEGQRRVVELHWIEGLTFPEISEALGVGLSAVKVRAHRGYKRLRALIGTRDGNPSPG